MLKSEQNQCARKFLRPHKVIVAVFARVHFWISGVQLEAHMLKGFIVKIVFPRSPLEDGGEERYGVFIYL